MARSSSGVREAYEASIRRLCATSVATLPGCPWPVTLVRIEAGEPVPVAGWDVGYAADFSRYWLHSDGRLQPVVG